jgi:hypothetical protein
MAQFTVNPQRFDPYKNLREVRRVFSSLRKTSAGP